MRVLREVKYLTVSYATPTTNFFPPTLSLTIDEPDGSFSILVTVEKKKMQQNERSNACEHS